MRILVIGGSGLVGSHVVAEARTRGHIAVGTYRRQSQLGLVELDLARPLHAEKIVIDFKPDWVVHAAGWTWVDGCEQDPNRALQENAAQPSKIAELCQRIGAHLAYFSSTYVFDGLHGPYKEGDVPNPINVYGHSKLEGENACMAACPSALVLRAICVWGAEKQRKNFAYQVETAVLENKSLRIPSDQEGNPTWAGDIAAWTIDLIELGESGVWHLAGPEPRCTRTSWLRSILRGLAARDDTWARLVADWNPVEVPTAILGQPSLRPLRAGVLTDKIQSRFPRRVRRPWEIDVLL